MYVYYSLCDSCTLFVCSVGPSTLSLRIVLIAFDSKVCSYMLGTPTLGGVCHYWINIIFLPHTCNNFTHSFSEPAPFVSHCRNGDQVIISTLYPAA